jgi:hypothetical protein
MNRTAPVSQQIRIARIRQRTYLVEEIVKSKRAGDSTLVKMSRVDDDNQGPPLKVLWEKELDPQVLTSDAWESIAAKGFDKSMLFAAYLNTLNWNCVTSTAPKPFQSPFRAGIRLDGCQLEPLRKTLLLPHVNLFIADEMGLRKTIEPALITSEWILRNKVREIFISSLRTNCVVIAAKTASFRRTNFIEANRSASSKLVCDLIARPLRKTHHVFQHVS